MYGAYEYQPDPTHIHSALLPQGIASAAVSAKTNPGAVMGLVAATAVGSGLVYAGEVVQSRSLFIPTVQDAKEAAPAVGAYVVAAGLGSTVGLIGSLAAGAVVGGACMAAGKRVGVPMAALWAVGSFLGSRYAGS